MTEQILLGFSGGADSTAAALLLGEKGYRVTALTLDFTGETALLEKAEAQAKRLGIAHRILDVRASFEKKVVAPFVAAYRLGETPNPCLICDTQVKLRALAEAADSLGIEKIATGHYLRLIKGRTIRVFRSPAVRKDQSYYFYRMPQAILRRLVTPLASFQDKAAVLDFLADRGITFIQGDESQGICFVAGDLGAFLKARLGFLPPGFFVDKTGRILGRHDGFYHFTLGQCRGIHLDRKYFVIGLEPQTNRVVLGEEADLYQGRIWLRSVSFLDGQTPKNACQIGFRICRWGYDLKGRYVPMSADSGYIEAETPVRAPAPGQAAVFYRGDEVLGGGIIALKGSEDEL